VTSLHHHLSTVEFDQWRQLYRRAVAAGSARVIDRDDERVAAPDELLVLALPGSSGWAPSRCLPTERETARGSAHGRSTGNPEASCGCSIARSQRMGATTATPSRHGSNTRLPARTSPRAPFPDSRPKAMPLSTVQQAVDAMAAAVIALHRDGLGVPGELADALGSILVLHVAVAGEVG
jgi:hypothetical protein